jgi:Flp pilus assembly protein TadD
MNLTIALACHRDNRLPEAEQACRTLLARDPSDPDAAQLLGVICRTRAR